ncbi:MAG: HEPN domain-containing protein [Anaerolineae bacterium]
MDSQSWLRQAQRDWEHAVRSLEGGDYEWACFAAQQSAEKAVKALFVKANAIAWGQSVSALLQHLPAPWQAAYVLGKMIRAKFIGGIISWLWWAALSLAVLGLIVLSLPYVLSTYYLERASASLARNGPAALRAAVNDLERASSLDGSNVQARRHLASAYLALAQPQAALAALRPAAELTPRNPMVSLALVDVYVALDHAESAVQAYEASGLAMPSPAAAAAYLQLAITRAQVGELAAAAALWEKALVADPGNLYALLRLYEAARSAGDVDRAARYADRLRYFDLRSVAVPSDARLADYQARAMADLVNAGVWTRETLLNVVSYQVWQFADGEAGRRAERVLDGLLTRWPDDADLRFFKAELYHRRGEWERAAAAYRAVLAADAEYAQAFLRLGMVYQARGDLAEAADWYMHYRALAPDDLLGLKRLVEVKEALGAPEAGGLREELLNSTDDRRIVGRLMGVSVDDVELGPNLVSSGDFEEWLGEVPRWWMWSDMATGDPWSRGLFVSGKEDIQAYDGVGARVHGLWLLREPDKSPGRAGYWLSDAADADRRPLELTPNRPYLVSLNYLSDVQGDSGAAIYVADQPELLWKYDKPLT